jgi:hypothetical protein
MIDNNITARLRAWSADESTWDLLTEAADEIERLREEKIDRLRAALEKIMQKCPYERKEKWCACIDCNCIIARAALEGEKKDD